MLVYPLHRQPAGRLLALGAVMLAVGSAISVASGLSFPYWPEGKRAAFIADTWQPPPAMIDAELAAWRGGWLDQQPVRSAAAFEFETFALMTWGVWRAGGLMLIGMALFQLGVFSADRPPRFYAALIAAAAAVGLPLQACGIALDFARGWPVRSFFLGAQFIYWPGIAVSLGYVGVVMLACRTAALRRLTRPLAAVGRTALTNYLLQTILCTTLFYGHGLGWFGSVDRVGQLGVVAAVWTVQLAASPLWLRRFHLYFPGRIRVTDEELRPGVLSWIVEATGRMRDAFNPVVGDTSDRFVEGGARAGSIRALQGRVLRRCALHHFPTSPGRAGSALSGVPKYGGAGSAQERRLIRPA